jgi:hypothetical protein
VLYRESLVEVEACRDTLQVRALSSNHGMAMPVIYDGERELLAPGASVEVRCAGNEFACDNDLDETVLNCWNGILHIAGLRQS